MKEIKHLLPKSERLHGKKNIDLLFAKGNVLVCYPYRVVYEKANTNNASTSVLISVPKRLYKRAVKRNWIKRRIKESYRLRKHILVAHSAHINYHLAFLYIGKEMHDYAFLDKKMEKALAKFIEIVGEKIPETTSAIPSHHENH